MVKLQIPAGKATPAPPVGTALGPQGVNIMEFCKAFNAKTSAKDQEGLIIPVVITIYSDRSFTFITKTPPVPVLIKRAVNLAKGSAEPNKNRVGKITLKQVEEIAKIKMPDLNCFDRGSRDEFGEGHGAIDGRRRHLGFPVRGSTDLRDSDVTPKAIYLDRRKFLAAALASPMAALAGAKLTGISRSSLSIDEKVTPYEIVSGYNNYYEFGTGKLDPAKNAARFRTSPWTVTLDGEVASPRTFDLDAILKLAPLEQRIYRHRCVEGWSIVAPWVGFSLSALLKQVEPTSRAKYVAFESALDPKQMPLATLYHAGISFPYVEGLRMDEAMHPLAMLAAGIYDEVLPNQNGAPLRLVVPWKYGFKSIKAIVRIRFVEKQPPTTWNTTWARAYGFYSNVNPQSAPAHSQKTELRLGEPILKQHRDTLMFNGYGEQVASLYAGMNLLKYY